jgi:hypothetical protein
MYRPSEFLEDMEIAGVVALASDMGSQQNVSLFHNLQLKFSNRRPSSNEPAHLENTRSGVSHCPNQVRTMGASYSPVHMLKRFFTLRVSTLCISKTSTVRTGVSSLEGIVNEDEDIETKSL